VQVVEAPGARVAAAQSSVGRVPVPLKAVTAAVGSVRVTLPVLVRVTV
jgi:hypothetical protein